MEKKSNKTLVDRLWQTIKNNRLVAILIIFGAIVIAVGQFTSALDDILSFIDRWGKTENNTVAPKSGRLIHQEKPISPCVSEGGAMAIKAYAIAVSYPDSLPAFITEHATMFAVDGEAIECFRILSSKLLSTALTGPSPTSIENKAHELARELGSPNLADAFANELQKERLDAYRLSKFMQSLAATLPSIAKGTVETYHNSEIYQQMNLLWSITEQQKLMSVDDLKTFRDMTLRINEWYLNYLATNLR